MACEPTGPCEGGYTRDQLLDLWKSSVDPMFSQQMLLLGEGEGSLEHITQAFEQLARVSCAIDRTTQAMFILPWSGQTGNPAQGANPACVQLTVSRTKFPELPLVLNFNEVVVKEVTYDASDTGATEVETGRRYPLAETLVFNAGEIGPFQVEAHSEKPGYGYNYPLPNTLVRIDQPGNGFFNDQATMAFFQGAWQLRSANEPDLIVPGHVGQYVMITGGANNGLICRIRGYLPPDLSASPPSGGTGVLDTLLVIECEIGGTPIPGEWVIQNTTGAQGVLLALTELSPLFYRVVISQRHGIFTLGVSPDFDIVCQQSLATLLTDVALVPATAIILDQSPVEEIGTVSWKILDWQDDLGVTLFNEQSPTGGRLGFLDELGNERGLPRAPGEPDDTYRQRVSTLADTVSPNALKRAANRILAPYGMEGCLRETGQLKLTGFYYDAPAPYNYFYDLDCAVITGLFGGSFINGEEVVLNVTPDLLPLGTYGIARGYYAGQDVSTGRIFIARKGINSWESAPGNFLVGVQSGATLQITGLVAAEGQPQDRFKLYMSYEEFRAFFLMGIPANDLGEFGFFFDNGPYNFFDSSPFLTFFDGFPINSAIINRSIWNALYEAHAGGVGFDLYQEWIGCNLPANQVRFTSSQPGLRKRT